MSELVASKRGISYPSMGLEEAVKRAEQLWNAERKNAAPVEVVVQHWKYSPKSSGGRLAIAALISFGILHDHGKKDERQVQLTPTALEILLNAIDSNERLEALQKAVIKPKIYSDLLSKWDTANLPSDATIRTYLIKDKDFNVKAVDGFIKDFKSSIQYARLNELTPNEELENDSETDGEVENMQAPPPQTKQSGTSSLPKLGEADNEVAGMRKDVFALNEGNAAIFWPQSMSEDSYEDFKDWVELVLRKVKRTINTN